MGGKCKNKMGIVSFVVEACPFFKMELPAMELPSTMPFEFVWVTGRWCLPCTGEYA